MNDKINGFVLSINDYQENDVLLRVLTKEYGILSLVGKAGKKLSSKNHFLNMCIYEFMIDLKMNKTMYTIHSSKLIKNYFDDKDLNLVSFKNILCEACIKNDDIDTYDEISFVFERINSDNMYLLGSMFFSYLIKQFGITPIVDSCALCSNKKVVSLSNRAGGFLCEEHLNGNGIIDVNSLKKFRLIIKGQFKDYDILKQFTYNQKDFNHVVSFYLDNSDLKLKSYDFFSKL